MVLIFNSTVSREISGTNFTRVRSCLSRISIGERAKRARHYQGCTSWCGICIVIARVGVKFGINFTSVRLSGNKIARGEAECYLPLNLTQVKFVPEISRLTVLLKINTIASLLFI